LPVILPSFAYYRWFINSVVDLIRTVNIIPGQKSNVTKWNAAFYGYEVQNIWF
jgi:hypothetical protein